MHQKSCLVTSIHKLKTLTGFKKGTESPWCEF